MDRRREGKERQLRELNPSSYSQRRKKAKLAKHYSSSHHILLVGEGDFSFSLSLATTFGSASNIVATSLDSYVALQAKYDKAIENLHVLQKMGATILHEIDATTMDFHYELKGRQFDRIVFNFPHAGFRGREEEIKMINLHRQLVFGLFRTSANMLRPHGEIHVTHKIGGPYRKWNLKELASKCSFRLVECSEFRLRDYPGYKNKRGAGRRPDLPFHLGSCCTFQFMIDNACKKLKKSNERFSPTEQLYLATRRKFNGEERLNMDQFFFSTGKRTCSPLRDYCTFSSAEPKCILRGDAKKPLLLSNLRIGRRGDDASAMYSYGYMGKSSELQHLNCWECGHITRAIPIGRGCVREQNGYGDSF